MSFANVRGLAAALVGSHVLAAGCSSEELQSAPPNTACPSPELCPGHNH
jgi:hypothetical protein